MHDVDSISLPQRRTAGRKHSTGDESASYSNSETSAHSARRLHDRTVIFTTRLQYALVIIGLQTGVAQLMFIFIKSEIYGGVLVFFMTFLMTFLISLPLMVHQMFYGFYNRYGFIKFWNMAPVAFGIGLSMALYSIYECVVWAALAGLLILHLCHVPFRNISEWTTCRKVERPAGVVCYDSMSNLSGTSCELTTYPALEFYTDISYKPQSQEGINTGWFVCCLVVWLIVFMMVSQGFRKLKNFLVRIPVLCLLSLALLEIFLIVGHRRISNPHEEEIFRYHEKPSRYAMVWLVWHIIRVVQIPLGTISQLSSYSPSGSPLLTDAVIILLFSFVYNFCFDYFAHCCHIWIEFNFVGIELKCLSTNEMTSLFASIPTAISFLAMGNLWLFVFYIVLILKTITQIVITLTATMNAVSEVFHLHRHRQQIVAVLCTVALLFNLPFTMMNSQSFLSKTYRLIELLVDLTIVSTAGAVIVCLYSVSRVFDDIQFVYNVEPPIFQKLISYLSAVLMTVVLITGYTSVASEWPKDPLFTANPWAAPFVAITVFLLLSPIPACALYMYVLHLMRNNISAMLQPTAIWGPPDAEVKRSRLTFNPRCELKHKSRKPCAHNCLLNNFRIKIEVEKRDSQRKEFFLNIVRSPSFAEWDDDEDWRYDIIRKARAIDWGGDFQEDMSSTKENKKSKEQRQFKTDQTVGAKVDLENRNAVANNGNLEKDLEEDVAVQGSDNVDAEATFISETDSEIRTERRIESDIIFPDLNSNKRHPGTRHPEIRTLPTPRYIVEHAQHLRGRTRWNREWPTKTPIEPPPTRKMYLRENEKLRKQSQSTSCQTEKGLKRLNNLIHAVFPWRKTNHKEHRCMGTNPENWPSTSFRKPPNSNWSSKESEMLSAVDDDWP